MEKENLNVLDEISKGACMGMDATKDLIVKIKDNDFKELVESQYKEYEKIKEDIDVVYSKYSEKEPHETNAMNKMMTWYGINMKTMTDDSNSKIAEILLQGTNMGIIEGKKILNNKNIDKDVEDIVDKYVSMQEKYVEKIKEYL